MRHHSTTETRLRVQHHRFYDIPASYTEGCLEAAQACHYLHSNVAQDISAIVTVNRLRVNTFHVHITTKRL